MSIPQVEGGHEKPEQMVDYLSPLDTNERGGLAPSTKFGYCQKYISRCHIMAIGPSMRSFLAYAIDTAESPLLEDGNLIGLEKDGRANSHWYSGH